MRIDVSMECPFCHTQHTVEVNMARFNDWQNGTSIQKAMPELSTTEREQLVSGLCPACQAKFFKEA